MVSVREHSPKPFVISPSPENGIRVKNSLNVDNLTLIYLPPLLQELPQECLNVWLHLSNWEVLTLAIYYKIFLPNSLTKISPVFKRCCRARWDTSALCVYLWNRYRLSETVVYLPCPSRVYASGPQLTQFCIWWVRFNPVPSIYRIKEWETHIPGPVLRLNRVSLPGLPCGETQHIIVPV